MAIALLFAGILLLVAGVRDTQGDLFAQVKKDFTGKNNFSEWVLAILLIGALGYIPKVKPFSVALLSLVMLSIFIKKGTGFFGQLSSAVNATANVPASQATITVA